MALDVTQLIFDCAVPTWDGKDIKLQAPFRSTMAHNYLGVKYHELSSDAKSLLSKHAKEIYQGKRRVMENKSYYLNK